MIGGEEAFVKSDYYKKLKAVFGDESLKDELQKAGYHMSLKIHPQMRRFAHFFDNLGVEILGDDAPYKKINAESALMVTDYSSAIFDFAYLQKPVIYYQFDREDFFAFNDKENCRRVYEKILELESL